MTAAASGGVRFEDVDQPEMGGTIELLLDGSEAPYLNKPDNMGIDSKGNLLIQEDPGDNAHLARIVAYDVDDRRPRCRRRVRPGPVPRRRRPASSPRTRSRAASSTPSEVLGKGWFLFDAQVHKAFPDPAKVEYGQLLALHVRKFHDVYTIDG